MKLVASVRLGAQNGARRRLGVIAGLLLTVWSGAAMAQNAYVPNFSSNNVSVINTATNAVVATVVVGAGPYGAAVTPDGTRAYVTNQTSNTVSVVNTATNAVVATVTVGTNPRGVAVSLDGTRAYVANFSSDNVSVINTATNLVVATAPPPLRGPPPHRQAATGRKRTECMSAHHP